MSARRVLAWGLIVAAGVAIGACTAADDKPGPGNVMAKLGACSTAPLGGDPACVCCGNFASKCVEGSPCAPAGASEACGARCPENMVCNPIAASGSQGACQRLRSAGEQCASWGTKASESNCQDGLACVPDASGATNTCQQCERATAACSTAAECCPCPGGPAQCSAGRCECPATDADGGFVAPECPVDSGYPCPCTGTGCADGSMCIKFGSATGICARACDTGQSCATTLAAPTANATCSLDFSSQDGRTIKACAVACSSSTECPRGEACRAVQSGRMCLP